MKKQELNLVTYLLENYTWKRGAPQIVVLKHLAANPSKKLHAKDRRMLNTIAQHAKSKDRERVIVDAKSRRNERRVTRQLDAVRSDR